jgi:hypothetical protein
MTGIFEKHKKVYAHKNKKTNTLKSMSYVGLYISLCSLGLFGGGFRVGCISKLRIDDYLTLPSPKERGRRIILKCTLRVGNVLYFSKSFLASSYLRLTTGVLPYFSLICFRASAVVAWVYFLAFMSILWLM